ncbi:MAG TPA: cadherin-like domain-containing protein, partial [Burkholderiales bacterium]
TDDVGINCPPGQFDCALASRLGPFLLPSDVPGGAEQLAIQGVASPVPGKKYIADPGRLGPVTGSTARDDPADPPGTFRANGNPADIRNRHIFRLEGPVGSGIGGPGQDFIESTDFSLVGRIFEGVIPGRVDITRATYEEGSGARKVDVLAVGQPTTQARLPAQPPAGKVAPNLTFFNVPCNLTTVPPGAPVGGVETAMFSAAIDYFGQLSLAPTDLRPTDVCVRDTASVGGQAFYPAVVTDYVDITQAVFDPQNKALSVTAASSEPVNVNGVPTTLTVVVPGAPTPPVQIAQAGTVLVTPLEAPPALVAVQSSQGGRSAVPVKIGFLATGGAPARPLAAADAFTVTEDTTGNLLNVLGNDVGGTPPVATTLQVVGLPAHGQAVVDAASGSISYTPTPDYFGPDTFTYIVSDSAGVVSNVATVSMTVTNVPDAPVAVNDTALLVLGSAPSVTLNLLANDVDADGQADLASAVILTLPASGTLTAGGQPVAQGAEVVGGSVVYTPTAAGTFSFTYLAKDQGGLTSATAATATISVSAPETLTFLNRIYNDSGASVGRWLIRGTSSIDAGQTLTISVTSVNGVPANIPLGSVVVGAGGVFDFRINKVADGNAVDVGAAGTLRITSTTGMVLDTLYNYQP